MPEEEEKKQALVEFYKLFTKLYHGWTENKKAIDYNAFRKLFEISSQDDKKGENKAAKEKGKAAAKKSKGTAEKSKGATEKGKGFPEKGKGAAEKGTGAQKGRKSEGKGKRKEKLKKWIRDVLAQMKDGDLFG